MARIEDSDSSFCFQEEFFQFAITWRLRMAVILDEGVCAVSDGDAEALAMSFDLYRLSHVQIKILIYLDNIIYLQSSIKRSPSLHLGNV